MFLRIGMNKDWLNRDMEEDFKKFKSIRDAKLKKKNTKTKLREKNQNGRQDSAV